MTDSHNGYAVDRESWRERVGFGLLVAMLLLMAASKAVLYDTLDPDCFWHLRVADQLHRDGIGPLVDDLSFSSMREPWAPYSWLAELGMKAIWDAGGYRAAIATQSIVIAVMFLFIALACLEMTPRPRPYVGVAAAVAFAGYLALPYLSFRPVTFALMFIAMCAWLLMRDRRMEEQTAAIWSIPLFSALLINLHPFGLFVPMWTTALLAGALWERARVAHWSQRAEHARRIRRYAILTCVTLLACLATPMLGGTIHTILHYTARDPMVAAGLIAELRPFYVGAGGWITGLILLAAIVAMWRARVAFRISDWMILAVGLIGLCRMGRLAPLFVMIAAPMLATALPKLRGRLLARPAVWLLLAGIVALGTNRVISTFPAADATLAKWVNRHGPDTPGYPCDAAEFIATSVAPANGRIINDFSWGGYLEWKLGPKFQTFMDARTQLYSPDFWESTCLGDQRTMQQALQTVRADAAVVPVSSTRLSDVLKALEWREVYRDDRASVFVPANSSTADTR